MVFWGTLVSMCIGFGLYKMVVVEADLQLQFCRVVNEFVWFLMRTAVFWCFHVELRCLVSMVEETRLFREETM